MGNKEEKGGELGFVELGTFELGEEECVGDTVGFYGGGGEEEMFVAVQAREGICLWRPLALPRVGGEEGERREKMGEAMFPPERERPKEDFVPAMRGEKVLESGRGKHWRSVVVQPKGGKWMVAVGNGRSVGIWRRRWEGSEGVEEMLAPALGAKLSLHTTW